MALTQMQLIQSLGEAMAWFERELNWGVPPTELRHLVGRIGELYAALVTNGQMATAVNQRGYDVVSGQGERISVKTTAMMGKSGHVSFNAHSLDCVDRIMVLRVNTEEMQVETLLDAPRDVAMALMASGSGRHSLALCKLLGAERRGEGTAPVRSALYGPLRVCELESGTIEVWRGATQVLPAKPALREIAAALGVPLVNGNGNKLTTRQLGSNVLRAIAELGGGQAANSAGKRSSHD